MTTRPVECPACGHEGIGRSSPGVEARAGRGETAADSWTCRLCAYTWTHQPRSGRRVLEGPDQLQL